MCRKPRRIRRAVGRGSGYSRLRSLSETVLKPIWERFPVERLAHRLTPPARLTGQEVYLRGYTGRPLRIAFLSDLHAGPTTPRHILESAFSTLMSAEPDAVLLGGDYVYLDADNIDFLHGPLSALAARHPTWGVWGNHDLWADDEYLARFFARTGVRMLCNEWEKNWLGEPLHLYGIDDPWTGRPDVAPLGDADAPVILLCHNPDGVLLLKQEHRAELMLCGHTHGGQVCRPDGRPYYVHSRTGTRFSGGSYEHAGRRIIVSRGVGTVDAPLRRYSIPEIMLLDIKPDPLALSAAYDFV